MENEKPFRFRNEATEIKYVDSWAYGTRDGMFYFALGIKDDIQGNTGHMNGAFIMSPESARTLYKQLGDLLDPKRKPDPPANKRKVF